MTLDGYLSRNYDDLLQAAYRIAGKDGPDLLHEVILQLYQTKQDTIDGLLERDQMKYWVLRVMVNNYNSKTSRYHYKWRKDIERRRKFARHIVDWWDGDGVAAHRDELRDSCRHPLDHVRLWADAPRHSPRQRHSHQLGGGANARGRQKLTQTIQGAAVQQPVREYKQTQQGDQSRTAKTSQGL